MIFSQIVGHTDIVENLKSMVKNNKLPHALLFTEQPGYGALTLVLALIQFMFCKSRKAIEGEGETLALKGLFEEEPTSAPTDDSCQVCPSCIKIRNLSHPDLHFVFPINTTQLVEKGKKASIDMYYDILRKLITKNPYFSEQELYREMGLENKMGLIGVSEANWIINKLTLSSFEGGERIVVILFPERMNAEAANKLLKSIEEPSDETYYFLVTDAPHKIIKTITSRCRIIEVPPIEQPQLAKAIKDLYNLNPDEATEWAKCSNGSLGRAIEQIEESEELRENFEDIIKLLELVKEKNMVELIEFNTHLSSLPKEGQKSFCINALKVFRSLYMFKLGLPELSYCNPTEKQKLEEMSKLLTKEYFLKGYNIINNTIDCIERNVNAKMTFCDMCNMLYINSI